MNLFYDQRGKSPCLKRIQNVVLGLLLTTCPSFWMLVSMRKRCLDNIASGRVELIRRLVEAKSTTLFNSEDLVNWLYKMKKDAQSETFLFFSTGFRSLASFRACLATNHLRTCYQAIFIQQACERLSLPEIQTSCDTASILGAHKMYKTWP